MSFRDTLLALRRRLLIVLVVAIAGGAVGWISAPGKARQHATFRATNTLLYNARGGDTYNLDQIALLATSGDVPSRVAARLNLSRDEVRSSVSAVAQTDVSTIAITGRSPQADRAVALADVTADELMKEISADQPADPQLARLNDQLTAAQNRLKAVPAKNAVEQAAAQADVDTARQALQQYQASIAGQTPLQTLEKAEAIAVVPSGVRAPDSRPIRALLLGIVGLLLGLGGALGLNRMDTRIRSKARAEEALRAPVVAEVPPIPKASQGKLLTLTEPTSPFVEAYRGLRTYVALWSPDTDLDDGHRVIVVTSPAPGEGKTTTVAHLAAMLAEIGRSVIVVSADLRRPRLHLFFDRAQSPGLVDVLAGSPDLATFGSLAQPTSVRGLRLVASGPATENPAPLFEHAGDLLYALRGLADFVLVDSPPLLVASDGVELARYADGVLLVSRAGQTAVDAAERSAELLQRLEIPVVGAVLTASEAASSASKYYSSRYYAEPTRSSRRSRSDAPASKGA